MSNTNPGGARGKTGRVFGAANIAKACSTAKRNDRNADNSIANKPHAHSREQARRLRQQAAREGRT